MDLFYKLNLNDFRILDQNIFRTVFIGKITKEDDTILITKSNSIENLENIKISSKCKQNLSNDRFYKCTIIGENKIDCSIIHPTTFKDIEKYQKKSLILVNESYQDYLQKVIPFVDSEVKWIQNIISHQSEQERILCEDKDFVFLPDAKWDGENVNSLYYLAIVKDNSLRSIRDLNEKHISLLEKIKKICVNKIQECHQIPENQIKSYFHYPPSFWHLHIHFNIIENFQFGSMCFIGHSLTNVINNIKLIPDYYQKADIEKMQS
jgi:m7GpppX diphosphatase